MQRQSAGKYFTLLTNRNIYIPALILIAIFSGLSYLNQHQIISTIEKDNEIINITGRQRMLSQKIILLCREYIENPTISNKEKLEKDISLMKDSHEYLLKHIDTGDLKKLYYKEKLNENVINYIKKIESINTFRNIDLLVGARKDSQNLLMQLDKAVQEYANYSNKKISSLSNSIRNIFLITLLILLLEGFFIFYPASKRIKHTTDQLYDINDKLEEKVKNKTKELQKYLDIINQHVLISTTDLNGVITYANEAFCRTSGYSIDELIGEPHNIIRHPDMAKSFFKEMWDTIQTGKTWQGKIKNLKKDGTYYWVDAVIQPHYDENNKLDSYDAIRIDITDKIELEEFSAKQEAVIEQKTKIANKERDRAQEYAKAKGEFLANMSHEIRTPLNAILGFIDILKEEDDGRKSLEYINVIDSSSKSLVQIINDILDFSKIESGKLNIDKIYFNPVNEFKMITSLFEGKCSQDDISLEVTIDENIPKAIKTDPLRVNQVITNLLSNSIKFTERGKKVFVNITHIDNMLKVSVKDQGKGIAEDKLQHIFEAFHQEDSSTTRKYGGTGLGLAISNELVLLLGGELGVKSELGVGSEFYFSIPVEIGEEIIDDNFALQDRYTFKNEKILVVEDNEANRMFMKISLKNMNLNFDFANDGIEAIEKYNLNKYSLIFMDENMPNMGGIEATKNIREYEKENNLLHTPIVALTANALTGDRERFLESGMDDYLTKPVNKSKLGEVIKKLIYK
ncbi:MAG: ATP-binding protein [Thiovulaceae bacterium]|nr:ATP-binding protein [Sulfurimonadaceae bacterium]